MNSASGPRYQRPKMETIGIVYGTDIDYTKKVVSTCCPGVLTQFLNQRHIQATEMSKLAA